MNEVNLPAIEPVTDEDVMVAAEESEKTPIGDDSFDVVRAILEQDRRRVAERQAARPLEKIDRDGFYGRSYIPVAPGWEVQTKGKGSTFRLCEPSGDRLAVPDSPYLHATIERMALAIHAHRVAMEEEVERLRAEVAAHRKHDVLRCDALMKAEAEVAKLRLDLDECDEELKMLAIYRIDNAKLRAACAQMRDTLQRCIAYSDTKDPDGKVIPDWLHCELIDAEQFDAGKNYIDATGAVEGRVQKLPVPASGWAGGTSLEHVTIPREWAGDRVLIVRVGK